MALEFGLAGVLSTLHVLPPPRHTTTLLHAETFEASGLTGQEHTGRRDTLAGAPEAGEGGAARGWISSEEGEEEMFEDAGEDEDTPATLAALPEETGCPESEFGASVTHYYVKRDLDYLKRSL